MANLFESVKTKLNEKEEITYDYVEDLVAGNDDAEVAFEDLGYKLLTNEFLDMVNERNLKGEEILDFLVNSKEVEELRSKELEEKEDITSKTSAHYVCNECGRSYYEEVELDDSTVENIFDDIQDNGTADPMDYNLPSICDYCRSADVRIDSIKINVSMNESEDIKEVSPDIISKYISYWDGSVTSDESIKELYDKYDLLIAEENGRYVAIDNRGGNCWTEEFPNKEDAIAWLNDEFEMSDYMEEHMNESEDPKKIENAVKLIASDYGINLDGRSPFDMFYAPEEDEYLEDYDFIRFYNNVLNALGANDKLLEVDPKVEYESDGKHTLIYNNGKDSLFLKSGDGLDRVVSNVKEMLENLDITSEEGEEPMKESNGYYNWKDDIEEVEPTEENDDIWYAVAENMVENGDYKGQDPLEVMSDIICLWKIDKDSILYKYLLKWYGSEEKLLSKVRDVYDAGDAIYFVTGVGYSIFDMDLLGGSADGLTEKKFEQFMQEN